MATVNFKTGLKPAKNDNNGRPFVGKKLPLVCSNNSPIYPSVGQYIPSISSAAFTLIEMLVTISVVAIVTILAVPEMRSIYQTSRLNTLSNSLISDLNTAKTQAVGRGAVVICTSSNGVSCNGAGWSSGRLIYADARPNDFIYTPGVDRLIRYTDPLPANSIAAGSGTTLPDPIVFNAQGALVNVFQQRLLALAPAPGLGGLLTMTLCDVNQRVQGRTIEVRTDGTATVNNVPPVCP